jgi:tetratricopeptide (TPR) repeat protein
LGAEHTDVANSLNGLAAIYYAQNEYDKADALYSRSLSIKEKALPEETAELASSMNNLATVYQAQEKFYEAGQLYQKAIIIAEINLGMDNVTTQEYKKNYEEMLTAKNANISDYLNKIKN